jgi:hypothetical protein
MATIITVGPMEPWVVSHFLAGTRYGAIRRALSGFLPEYLSFHHIGEGWILMAYPAFLGLILVCRIQQAFSSRINY